MLDQVENIRKSIRIQILPLPFSSQLIFQLMQNIFPKDMCKLEENSDSEPGNKGFQNPEHLICQKQNTESSGEILHPQGPSSAILEREKLAWDDQELLFLYNQYRLVGPKWTLIAQSLPGKSENSVKNKFYGTLRKMTRKINEVGKKFIPKFTKRLRYESIMRVLEVQDNNVQLPQKLMIQSSRIRNNLIGLLSDQARQDSRELVLGVIEQINAFNLSTRCYKFKKQTKRNKNEEIGAEMKIHKQIVIKTQPLLPFQAIETNGQRKFLHFQSCRTEQNKLKQDQSNLCRLQEDQNELELPIPCYPSSSGDEGQDLDIEFCEIMGRPSVSQKFSFL